ncbi:redox-sensitive transcriptional activator SoxR [Streptomyces tateyamensis]|uniref:Redox-sensitive transcriptional activator SoxR n=1 Tax=Streptomyces tateyamensis TaxID=565073 RepID=A0A2V4PAX2_9ACTN|nr:redox-sensitive transcriptional activator SoxR [Streptomyces tateyamensis]PYC88119.1 redox-sensitive transcriptional activator SoxR [Streptomyces tateyamensis]
MVSTVLTIGELAARAGVAPSALRYYEELGLIHAERSAGGQRRYQRHTLRRIAFVRAAQTVGLSLDEVAATLAALPPDRAPTQAQWQPVAATWQQRIDEQIEDLRRLRDRLDGCIGCGCLSLERCALYNPRDVQGAEGPGARKLLPRRAR